MNIIINKHGQITVFIIYLFFICLLFILNQPKFFQHFMYIVNINCHAYYMTLFKSLCATIFLFDRVIIYIDITVHNVVFHHIIVAVVITLGKHAGNSHREISRDIAQYTGRGMRPDV